MPSSMKDFKQAIHFELWRRIHTMPRFFVDYWQARQMRRVVAMAFHHVPFYREYYSQHGIHPKIIKTLGDVAKLPLTNKNLLRQQRIEHVVNGSFPVRRRVW